MIRTSRRTTGRMGQEAIGPLSRKSLGQLTSNLKQVPDQLRRELDNSSLILHRLVADETLGRANPFHLSTLTAEISFRIELANR